MYIYNTYSPLMTECSDNFRHQTQEGTEAFSVVSLQ